MGTHDTTDRMRHVITALQRFYARRHQELGPRLHEFGSGFKPDINDFSDGHVDAPYLAYIAEMSKGADQVLAPLGVKVTPLPPGPRTHARDETLMAGAMLLKWIVDVHDIETNGYLGQFEWGMYHRHDRFAVPGPAQVTYLRSRGGKTVMVS